jgi:hypothetical protein
MPAPTQICTQVTADNVAAVMAKNVTCQAGARRAAWLADPRRRNSASAQRLLAR